MQGHDYEFSAMHRERVRDIQRALTGQTVTPGAPPTERAAGRGDAKCRGEPRK
jgi:hypothetical protein